MNLYPALRCSMGSWQYFVVKMNMRELSDNVQFASQVYDDRTLDEAIQRVLNDKRVKSNIVSYLSRQPDRFFSSVVVAALEGDPKFYPVEIADDERFAVFRDDGRLNETFGVLRFDGTQRYYALDGQHRLAAIKTLLDRNDPLSEKAPEGFEHEEMSVIVVVPTKDETTETFMQKYRRLFSHLNRYAKPTDQVTNIIMDEDDTFAILTRRLITDHDFFQSPGVQKESRRVKTTKGKNLREADPYFTSLEALYNMNIALLSSARRENRGWDSAGEGEKLDTFKRFRPTDEYIDVLYDELVRYWNGLLSAIPALKRDPPQMRVHSLEDSELDGASDHLLFWPIGQEMLAMVARNMLDKRLPDGELLEAGISGALEPLGKIDWELHDAPWRYFLLIWDESRQKWKIRNEERSVVLRIARRIVRWLVGLDELNEDEVADLRLQWGTYLMPAQRKEDEEELWASVESSHSLFG